MLPKNAALVKKCRNNFTQLMENCTFVADFVYEIKDKE